MFKKPICVCLIGIIINHFVLAQAPESRSVLLKFKDEVTTFNIQGVFVLPNEVVEFETLFDGLQDKYILSARYGSVQEPGDNKWKWKAPSEKGIYPVFIKRSDLKDSIQLNCIVMVPYKAMKNGKINGYTIGSYPKSTNKLYAIPAGFIEVTKANERTLVTPNYMLKDFLCKQSGGYPKYIALRERGIIKLQTIQGYLQQEGIPFNKFSFISGYRTPFYNKSIGNVKNSRHIFGDAYDVFIDNDGDGKMDDLNQDGVLNKKDARFLFNKVNEMSKTDWFRPFIGGLGLYGPNSRHSGFIHIDGRGYRARWGS